MAEWIEDKEIDYSEPIEAPTPEEAPPVEETPVAEEAPVEEETPKQDLTAGPLGLQYQTTDGEIDKGKPLTTPTQRL